jgi:hypothetical protein
MQVVEKKFGENFNTCDESSSLQYLHVGFIGIAFEDNEGDQERSKRGYQSPADSLHYRTERAVFCPDFILFILNFCHDASTLRFQVLKI